MSIRVIVCLLAVIGFSIYAWRNWFVSLCAAVVLMAFLQHPDMPKSIGGIQGLNLWNVLYINVFLAWFRERSLDIRQPALGKALKMALLLYCGVIFIGCARALIEPTRYYEGGPASLLIDYLVNPLKFLSLCLLAFYASRTRTRTAVLLGCILLLYFLLAVQVTKGMGLHFDLSGEELDSHGAKVVSRSVGYHRVEMSMMLAGASWAFIAYARLVSRWIVRWGLFAAAGAIVLAQGLTAGRSGYVSWGVVGLILCVIKWRRMLPVLPVAAVAMILLVPGIGERMFAGFGQNAGPIVTRSDSSKMTSGRTVIWPHVIKKIRKSPLIGYGRIAMVRTGLFGWLKDELGEEFQHPHNAYFEVLLDNGILGLACVVPIYLLAARRSISLFLDRGDRLFEVAGGVALALILALLAGGIGGQTFYPREGVVGMWAAIGVAMRVWVEREQARVANDNALVEQQVAEFRESQISDPASIPALG